MAPINSFRRKKFLYIAALLCQLAAAASRPARQSEDVPLLQVNTTALNRSGEWVEVGVLRNLFASTQPEL